MTSRTPFPNQGAFQEEETWQKLGVIVKKKKSPMTSVYREIPTPCPHDHTLALINKIKSAF